MRRILVTGCAGFIGGNLCTDLVEEGYDVVGIDNLMAGSLENVPAGVDFHEVDIRDSAIQPLFEGVDAVFHLAARNCPSDCMNHPVETADINVVGTVRVLEACRQFGVGKLIYADTSAEYEGMDQFPSTEEQVRPLGPYAVSKLGGAAFVESYARLYGQRFTTLRYFNVYGPAQDYRRVVPPVMSAFILKMLKGERPRICGNGEKRRDFVYVDDVNRFHLCCLRDERTDGRTLNIGSGTSHSILEIYQAIEAQLQTGLAPVFADDLPGEARLTLADISAAKCLGFQPSVSLKEGLSRTVAFLRQIVEKHQER
jgi:UDP-glucose 4-epimerase